MIFVYVFLIVYLYNEKLEGGDTVMFTFWCFFKDIIYQDVKVL